MTRSTILPLSLDDIPGVDMHSAEFLSAPHAVFSQLRQQAPLARSRRGLEVIDYQWMYDLYADRRLDTPGVAPLVAKGTPERFTTFLEQGFLLGFHGERHNRIRKVVQKGFTPRQVDRQRQVMRQCAAELVDNFDGNEIDFVESFSIQFPVVSICRILGVPEQDIPQFKEAGILLHLMGAVPLAPGYPKIEEGLGILYDYVSRLVADRRRRPGEDFISALIEAEHSEGRLTEAELVWNIVNLLFAGQDTTRFQLAGVVRAAIEEPGEAWERLAADPRLVGSVLAEGYRFYPAVQWSSRQPLEDIEYDGIPFSRGQWIFLHNLAASRDPNAFPDPDRYDIEREQRFALPFGRGLHHCVGQLLAKIGMEEAMLILTRRLADPRIVGDVHSVSPTAMVGGPEHLPIGFRLRT